MLLILLYHDSVSERLRPSQAGARERAAATSAASATEPEETRPATRAQREYPEKRKLPRPLKPRTLTSPSPRFPPTPSRSATETGLASWYGPPYHNRRGSNGEIYNMHAMTAAHRTYPLGSIVRVTNVKTGMPPRWSASPIADRSFRDAFSISRWPPPTNSTSGKPGVAEVKVELMQSAATAGSPGKWAVQIGGFPARTGRHETCRSLKRRYHTAKVLCFASPAGDWWVRVRVLDDDHDRAQKLAAETQTPEGAVFLVRLD